MTAPLPYLRPTRMQREVLARVLEAGTVKAAAEQLGISPITAHNHLYDLRRRLGVRSTEHAVALGTRDGWLRLPRSH